MNITRADGIHQRQTTSYLYDSVWIDKNIMTYQLKNMRLEDYKKICADLRISEPNAFYQQCWEGGFFKGFAQSENGNYLVRKPDAGSAGSRWLQYAYGFEGRVFRVSVEVFGDEAVIHGATDVPPDRRDSIERDLVSAFCVNGYYGAGKNDQTGELNVRWG